MIKIVGFLMNRLLPVLIVHQLIETFEVQTQLDQG